MVHGYRERRPAVVVEAVEEIVFFSRSVVVVVVVVVFFVRGTRLVDRAQLQEQLEQIVVPAGGRVVRRCAPARVARVLEGGGGARGGFRRVEFTWNDTGKLIRCVAKRFVDELSP